MTRRLLIKLLGVLPWVGASENRIHARDLDRGREDALDLLMTVEDYYSLRPSDKSWGSRIRSAIFRHILFEGEDITSSGTVEGFESAMAASCGEWTKATPRVYYCTMDTGEIVYNYALVEFLGVAEKVGGGWRISSKKRVLRTTGFGVLLSRVRDVMIRETEGRSR